jgi:hypothetical protein
VVRLTRGRGSLPGWRKINNPVPERNITLLPMHLFSRALAVLFLLALLATVSSSLAFAQTTERVSVSATGGQVTFPHSMFQQG